MYYMSYCQNSYLNYLKGCCIDNLYTLFYPYNGIKNTLSILVTFMKARNELINPFTYTWLMLRTFYVSLGPFSPLSVSKNEKKNTLKLFKSKLDNVNVRVLQTYVVNLKCQKVQFCQNYSIWLIHDSIFTRLAFFASLCL